LNVIDPGVPVFAQAPVIKQYLTGVARGVERSRVPPCRFEQAFSEDGGKTREVNWIAVDTRLKE
jgi:hypothetical protein